MSGRRRLGIATGAAPGGHPKWCRGLRQKLQQNHCQKASSVSPSDEHFASIRGKSETKRAASYVRVSTDRQTVENQKSPALLTIASARGWQIVQTFSDAGSSGARGRKDRPGLDEMLKASATAPF